jgi:hypothetical protein
LNVLLDLSRNQRSSIRRFVNDNIETVYDERHAYGSVMDFKNGGVNLTEDICADEYVDGLFVGYWCRKCQNWVKIPLNREDGKIAVVDKPCTDDEMIAHVIEHIKHARNTKKRFKE